MRRDGPLPAEVLDGVREQLARSGAALSPEVVARALRDQGRPVGDSTVLAVHDLLRQDVLGAGPLEPLVRLPGVTDVLVNGPAAVYVDRGEGLELTSTRFADEAAVRRLAQRLAGSVGRRLDDATPYVDLRLPDGTRFHAVLAPLARPGTVISLRVPRARVFSVEELRERGTVNADAASLLRRIVETRLAFLVSGGTGSGKTTLLSALLSLVDPRHRMVLVEDASELRPDHPHVVGLESRPANVEGAGEVPMRVLVRQALRMRPDRLVVGEVRGDEVTDLLAAMNTGHEGGCGTVHANSAADVPARVEALAMPAGLPRAAVHSQLAAAVDAVVHLARGPDGRRRVAEVAALRRTPGGVRGRRAGGDLRRGRAHPRASRGRGAAGPAGRRAGPVSVVAVLAAAAAVALLWPARARGPAPAGGPAHRPGAAPVLVVALAGAAAALLVLADGTRLALGLVSLGAVGGSLLLVRRGRAAKAATARQAVVVDVCEAMVGELRAGQPPTAGLEHCRELWPDLEPVVAAARLGADVPAALRRLAAVRGAEGLAEVASAWQVSERSGAGLATALGTGGPHRARAAGHPAAGAG